MSSEYQVASCLSKGKIAIEEKSPDHIKHKNTPKVKEKEHNVQFQYTIDTSKTVTYNSLTSLTRSAPSQQAYKHDNQMKGLLSQNSAFKA
ncbi:hypothetical protein H5410_034916 [Solanum commersonii]|uniref:Uncharacterized protein n=1 Tax=Solanum commersonii TaxID=4109 RepID=A0A9J5Y321_SOLCO|nr:hypothetical protein H5410_034916 [Solanum commersonii]